MVFASQGANDHYPFVIAGRYGSSQIDAGGEKINLWTKKTPEAAKLKELSEALLRATKVYDEVFGARTKERSATWIVECPVATGCFTLPTRTNVVLLGEKEGEPTLAEMVSADTLMAELRSDAPRVGAVAAPSLAASWLGYAQNPGFLEREPPLSALPAFAASIVREAAEGTDSRAETIRRALQLIPEKTAAREPEDQAVARAKSFLFFYALQDRYGREAFRKAMSHMLQARRERGLELSDLIAAFDQEANQNAAEFVRLWMKRPGVPEEFRARYREGAAAPAQSEKETAR